MTQIKSPVKAIRAKCLECSCESAGEVKDCPVTDCALYPFRFGKNPFIKREYTQEQRDAMASRLKKARDIKENNEE